MKSANCISDTGRKPRTAAPAEAPMMSDSEIGVSMTRAGPKRSRRPRGDAEGAAELGHVLAQEKTVGSRSISSNSVSLIASR